jgi:hypothetical protein
MIGAAHAVAPEELMALMDGELAGDEARVVAAHVDECAECGELMRQFRGVSESLAGWTMEEMPQKVEEAVMAAAEACGESAGGGVAARRGSWRLRTWALGGGGALVAFVLLLVLSSGIFFRKERKAQMAAEQSSTRPEASSQSIDGQAIPLMSRSKGMDSLVALQPGAAGGLADSNSLTDAPAPPPPVEKKREALGYARAQEKIFSNGGGGGGTSIPAATAPMIARTVSLTLVVKDVPAARAALDGILARRQGYAAQLTVNTPEGGARSFQASLRVPAGELGAALGDLRALGRVENEAQAGEEVTQQHADLVARLQNSRETEQRLKDILAQRTGKIEDVLQVEEEIARVRGEIEGMEADQKALEHRVDFSSVDLQLTEVYKAQLGTPSPSVGNEVQNAFVMGVQNAGASLLGLLLFVEEVGPVLLVWVGILGVPGWLVWRRYRRMRGR